MHNRHALTLLFLTYLKLNHNKMDTIVTASQKKTISVLRNTIEIFSNAKEKHENIIKKGVPTSVLVSFETDENGIYQYQITKAGAIVKMTKVLKH